MTAIEAPAYHMHTLREPYFSQLVEGTKTVEARLRRGLWLTVKVGDTIEFTSVSAGTKGFNKRYYLVRGVEEADTFVELWHRHGAKLLPDAKTEADVEHVYREDCKFSKADEKSNGVIGITLSLLA